MRDPLPPPLLWWLGFAFRAPSTKRGCGGGQNRRWSLAYLGFDSDGSTVEIELDTQDRDVALATVRALACDDNVAGEFSAVAAVEGALAEFDADGATGRARRLVVLSTCALPATDPDADAACDLEADLTAAGVDTVVNMGAAVPAGSYSCLAHDPAEAIDIADYSHESADITDNVAAVQQEIFQGA